MQTVRNLGMKFVNKVTNIGGSLQTPIAILPAAGILLALGTIFTSQSFLNMMPFADNNVVQQIFNVCLQCGSIIFGNLPVIFAVGVAIGLSKNDGVAALSAIVGYLIMNVTIGGILNVTPKTVGYANILGIDTLQTGVLGGIFIGVLASSLYNKFHDVKLPQALQFFAGKRSVPILTAFCAFFLGIVMCFAWPPVQMGINNLSRTISGMNSGLAGFMFGFVERLTIPFGMNHVWWPTFWLQAGEYVTHAGKVVNGDQLIFFAQLADGVKSTGGTFMNGLFILKMFSMPAIALAMYKNALPENKAKVKGILLSGAITSVVCGITEPLEFCFIFAAPALFGVYAVVTGLGFTAINLIGAHMGLSFSGGLLDYLFFNVFTNKGNWWLAIPVGVVWAVINYYLFYFAIKKFNFKTPGRRKEAEASADTVITLDDTALFTRVIAALGGADNITNVNACFSRLRVDVKDTTLVDKDAFAGLQANGVSILGKNVQVIYGQKASAIRDGVLAVLSGQQITGKSISETASSLNVSTDPEKLFEIASPADGEVMEIAKVPDEVFACKSMGDGFAVNPTTGIIKSPINGKVLSIFPTKHAICLLDDYKNEVLIHMGIDTVNLNGVGIDVKVKVDERVTVGQEIAKIDLQVLKDHELPPITTIVFTNLDTNRYNVQVNTEGEVTAGAKDLIKIVSK
ncbi:MAG: glucose PTS transporter subunit IIA [Streptococcaceae bacterium]|jgi:PTS system D-glucosamine-specific IIC component|nr:glucose PTS transporter subunit IIA [Streptococcaceae bacterium]